MCCNQRKGNNAAQPLTCEETNAMQKLYSRVGPSGSGKTTLMDELVRRNPDFLPVKSVTTRQPRNTAEPNYRFVTEEAFNSELKAGNFLEWSTYAGNRYGTASSDIDAILNFGKNAVKAMDISGAKAVKERFGDRCMTVFIQRSRDSVIRSILDRKTADADIIARLASLDREDKNKEFCDVILENTEGVDELYNNFIQKCFNFQ